jgi:hypothetical protein
MCIAILTLPHGELVEGRNNGFCSQPDYASPLPHPLSRLAIGKVGKTGGPSGALKSLVGVAVSMLPGAFLIG